MYLIMLASSFNMGEVYALRVAAVSVVDKTVARWKCVA